MNCKQTTLQWLWIPMNLVFAQLALCDVWYPDFDSDGFGGSAGIVISNSQPGALFTMQAGDGDDSNSNVNPTMPEFEDGIDNNGNGIIDEGFPGETIVNTAAPSAFFQTPAQLILGDNLTLDASGSFDLDNNIASYLWDIDGDSMFDFVSSGSSLTLDFQDYQPFISGSGTYQASVLVIDEYFASDSAFAEITAVPEPSTMLAIMALSAIAVGCSSRHRPTRPKGK
jgi:hypothetical protein